MMIMNFTGMLFALLFHFEKQKKFLSICFYYLKFCKKKKFLKNMLSWKTKNKKRNQAVL